MGRLNGFRYQASLSLTRLAQELYRICVRRTRNAGEIIDTIAINYRRQPRLILSLLDYQVRIESGQCDSNTLDYPLGYRNPTTKVFTCSSNWAATC